MGGDLNLYVKLGRLFSFGVWTLSCCEGGIFITSPNQLLFFCKSAADPVTSWIALLDSLLSNIILHCYIGRQKQYFCKRNEYYLQTLGLLSLSRILFEVASC